jgi:arylsulfatase A-like enzyme
MARHSWLLAWCALVAVSCALSPGAAPPPAAAPAPDRHPVIVVTLDGLRPDAIDASGTPNLARLLRQGASSLASRVPHPPETLPSHFSMATGQTAARHGLHTNRTLDRDPANVTLFTAAHAAGWRTALYFGKSKLIALAPRGSADVAAGPGRGESNWEAGAGAALAARFAREFPRERFGLAWVHLREADMAGHAAGWMTPEYHAGLAEADRALGVVLDAIAASGLPATVILTSDHGGHGKNHWGKHPADSIVPWICAGPGVKAGATIEPSSVIDVGPTAAALLGVALPDVEGQVVKECLPTSAR